LSFSRDDARRLVLQSRQKRDDAAWAPVEAAGDDVARVEPARAYLATFPNGRHAREAGEAVQRGEDTLKDQKNTAHRDAVRRELATLKANLKANQPTLDKLHRLEERLKQVPHPERERKEQFAARRKLADDIGAAM